MDQRPAGILLTANRPGVFSREMRARHLYCSRRRRRHWPDRRIGLLDVVGRIFRRLRTRFVRPRPADRSSRHHDPLRHNDSLVYLIATTAAPCLFGRRFGTRVHGWARPNGSQTRGKNTRNVPPARMGAGFLTIQRNE
jgi:hypothetical protein